MKYILPFFFLFFFRPYAVAQAEQTRIDSLIRFYMEAYRIPGLSLAIVKDGQPFLIKGYGYTSVDKVYPVTGQTLFHTASVTKLFTATAIMQWVDQGKIRLSDKVTDHLPDFSMKDKRYTNITIAHLLTHSSGLPWEHAFSHSPDDTTALEKYTAGLRNAKLKFNPGEKFDGTTYSNVAYNVLGLIVQRKSGMPYDAYVRKYILEPAGMHQSTFDHDRLAPEIKALPHILSGTSREIIRFNLYGEVRDENPVLKYPGNPIIVRDTYGRKKEYDPSDGFISSAHDLGLWIQLLLEISRDTTGQHHAVISPNTLNRMWALHRPIRNSRTSMGLGWWRYADERTGDYVFHVGREPGFCSTLMIWPERNAGIAILCNGMFADQVVWNILPGEIMKIAGLVR